MTPGFAARGTTNSAECDPMDEFKRGVEHLTSEYPPKALLSTTASLSLGLFLNQSYQFLHIEWRPFIHHPGSPPSHRHD